MKALVALDQPFGKNTAHTPRFLRHTFAQGNMIEKFEVVMLGFRNVVAWAALASLVAAPAVVEAADLPGPIGIDSPIDIEMPCADTGVLTRILQRFDWAERHTWHRGFTMQELVNGRLSGHPYAEPGIIRREFCMADSTLTNGARHTVYYAIEYGQGLASIGNYVDWCVLGLDPWYVHDESCRTVR